MQNSGIFACRNIYNLILRSRRLELVDARKNGEREGDTQGERELPLPSRVFRALVFFFVTQILPTACQAGYYNRGQNRWKIYTLIPNQGWKSGVFWL